MNLIKTLIALPFFATQISAQEPLYSDIYIADCYNSGLYYNPIDSISQLVNGIWHYANTDKNTINANYNPSHSIITDSANFYPINDTSSIEIRMGYYPPLKYIAYTRFSGKYWVDTDSLEDYVTLEFKIGPTDWFNIDDDSVNVLGTNVPMSEVIDHYEEVPVFTGKSNGWKSFDFKITLNDMAPNYYNFCRFTFYSDSIQDSLDGFAFDDLSFCVNSNIGLDELIVENEINCYPNPSDGNFNLYIGTNDLFNLEVYDATGRLIQKQTNISLFGGYELNLTNENSGIYLLKLKNESGEVLTRKIEVSK